MRDAIHAVACPVRVPFTATGSRRAALRPAAHLVLPCIDALRVIIPCKPAPGGA
jgi:hypothetical protein